MWNKQHFEENNVPFKFWVRKIKKIRLKKYKSRKKNSPFRSGSAWSSTSFVDLYLDDPWDFFGFLFKDPFLKGSILSTKGVAVKLAPGWAEVMAFSK